MDLRQRPEMSLAQQDKERRRCQPETRGAATGRTMPLERARGWSRVEALSSWTWPEWRWLWNEGGSVWCGRHEALFTFTLLLPPMLNHFRSQFEIEIHSHEWPYRKLCGHGIPYNLVYIT